MIKISNFLKYSGEDFVQGNMYTDVKKAVVQGRIEFSAFGTVYLNGVAIKDTRVTIKLAKPTEVSTAKDSAILFHGTPPQLEHPVSEPLPPVPDMEDEQIRMMHRLFEQWAMSRGLRAEGEGDSPSPNYPGDDGDIEDEDLDPDDWDIDVPLVDPDNVQRIDTASRADSLESDGDISSDAVANSESLSELAQVTPGPPAAQTEQPDQSTEVKEANG
jgi:hypothetical protein